jgi:hypothetical protein
VGKPWDLALTVDAVGHDAAHVRARRFTEQGAHPHLSVRTGPVIVYCLDARSVTDMASAWAAAQVRGAHLLPVESPAKPTPKELGSAFPIAEVVMEGRQQWNIGEPTTGRHELLVSVGRLTFRVHDKVALDTQVRAWAQASAYTGRVYSRRTPPFDQLLEQAQIAAVRMAARDHDRQIDRGRRTLGH